MKPEEKERLSLNTLDNELEVDESSLFFTDGPRPLRHHAVSAHVGARLQHQRSLPGARGQTRGFNSLTNLPTQTVPAHHALSSTSFGHPAHLVCCAPDDHSLQGQGVFSGGRMALGRLSDSTANAKGGEWDASYYGGQNPFFLH
jgi:hypothetical protein